MNWIVVRLRKLPISFRLERRVPPILLILGLVAVAAILISVGQGEYDIPPLDVLKTLLGIQNPNQDYSLVINTLRLPRVLAAFLVGVGLSISGTILQGITRNSLAEPGIIGVTPGASLAAVILIVLFPSSLFSLPFAAFAGGFVVTILIYLLAWDQGSSPIRLILVGIGLSAIATAITSAIVTKVLAAWKPHRYGGKPQANLFAVSFNFGQSLDIVSQYLSRRYLSGICIVFKSL